MSDIKEWTGLTVTNASRLANDRRRWKALIQTTPALLGVIRLMRERSFRSYVMLLVKGPVVIRVLKQEV